MQQTRRQVARVEVRDCRDLGKAGSHKALQATEKSLDCMLSQGKVGEGLLKPSHCVNSHFHVL